MVPKLSMISIASALLYCSLHVGAQHAPRISSSEISDPPAKVDTKTDFKTAERKRSEKVSKSAVTRIQLLVHPYKTSWEKADKFYINMEARNGRNKRKFIKTDRDTQNISWTKFNVEVKGACAQFDKGNLSVIRNYIDAENHEIRIRISPKNNPNYILDTSFSLPYIDSIYASKQLQASYRPGEAVDLSFIQVKYNTGKIYPFTQIHKADQFKIKFLSQGEKIPGGISMPILQKDPTLYCYSSAILTGKEYFVPFRIRYNFAISDSVNLSGSTGYEGSSGGSGRSSFSDGSCSNTRDGEHGSTGADGGDGADGKDVDVYLKKFVLGDSSVVIKASVLYRGEIIKTSFFDPKYASFYINVCGGNGGKGGTGGNGGYGADGKDRSTTGQGGNGGDGGQGGRGGNGGTVKVYILKSEKEIATSLQVLNRGGHGGDGGAGGKKGRAGSPEVKGNGDAIWSLLGAYSGNTGNDGAQGYAGKDGPPPILIFADKPEENAIVEDFKEWH